MVNGGKKSFYRIGHELSHLTVRGAVAYF